MVENVISETSSETTARGIWIKLENLYLNKSSINCLILPKIFFTIKMEEGTSVKSHLSLFDDLSVKMKTVDLKVNEDEKMVVLLCFLLKRYTGFDNNLIYDRDTLILGDVKSGLLYEDLRD